MGLKNYEYNGSTYQFTDEDAKRLGLEGGELVELIEPESATTLLIDGGSVEVDAEAEAEKQRLAEAEAEKQRLADEQAKAAEKPANKARTPRAKAGSADSGSAGNGS